jgi:hypothetical protein
MATPSRCVSFQWCAGLKDNTPWRLVRSAIVPLMDAEQACFIDVFKPVTAEER